MFPKEITCWDRDPYRRHQGSWGNAQYAGRISRCSGPLFIDNECQPIEALRAWALHTLWPIAFQVRKSGLEPKNKAQAVQSLEHLFEP